jgi:hypothetical protein
MECHNYNAGSVIGVKTVQQNGDFLYTSIKNALDDGWRIIKFPEMSLAMNEQDTYGLGYEFVLERWR